MIPPELQANILARYYGQKQSMRRIARELELNRKSVEAVIERRAVILRPRGRPKASILDPFKPRIAEILKANPSISVETLLQLLRNDGYHGGYTILREWVKLQRELPHRSREAFLRIQFAPGECAQVDWAEFGDVFGDGVKIHCFLMVLCYSRLLYIEFTRSEKFEEFLRCHENAFRYFGGVPRECWYDNLRSAVIERMGSLIHFNPLFMAYLGHHGIHPHACNPARGNEKGRVEDAVKFLRSSFWAGRKFRDFEGLCAQAAQWRDQIANQREHRVTRKIPRLLFDAEEKATLLPMNPSPYDTDEILTRVVPPNFHIPYDTNRYSVPWTLVGHSVTVRVNARDLTVFYHDRFITRHERCYLKYQTISQEAHSRGLIERKPGVLRDTWQVSAVKQMGEPMPKYLELLRGGHRSLRFEVSKILALATVYGEQAVRQAAAELLNHQIIGAENLELSLKRAHPPETELAPKPLVFQNDKLNRVVPMVDLRRYDALLFASTRSREVVSPGKTTQEASRQGNDGYESNDTDPRGGGTPNGGIDTGSAERDASRIEVEALESGPQRRGDESSSSGTGNHSQMPESLDAD